MLIIKSSRGLFRPRLLKRKMWGLNLVILFALILTCASDRRLLVDQLRWDFLELENSMWDQQIKASWHSTPEEEEFKLVRKFDAFDKNVTQMPSDLLFGAAPLRSIPDFLFLYSNLIRIDDKYTKFRIYLKQQMANCSSNNEVSMEDIINDVLNSETGVDRIMPNIYQIAYEQRDSMIQELQRMAYTNFWCKDLAQSQQQLFYNLYNLIALTGLKAYIMQQFSYLGSSLWDKGNYAQSSEKARETYQKKSISILNRMTKAMDHSNDIWRCDPKTFSQGENYDQFTRLLQGHIQNEADMSSSGTCTKTCYEYQYTKSYGCYDYMSDVCQRTQRCNGNIIGCFFVESHASICVSRLPHRRYDFVRYDSGKTLGRAISCPNTRTVNSWTRWFVRCHYCMCLCDEQGPKSDRYINLRPVKSDVKKNMVVTGVRLVKHNRILHIQIQQGKLLPYGYIDQQSVHWKEVDDYRITDPEVKNGVDMHTMSYGNSGMVLDEIQIRDELHVLTGVSFKYLKNQIHFQINVSPFDWQNGTIDLLNGYDIYESSKSTNKQEIVRPDVPTRTPTPSVAYHGHKYVEFTHTDFDKDAAQTTIPFIDIQEVVSKPAVPLNGAGIYYKGNKGFGGFIAPMIKTYNFQPHLSTKMPPIEDHSVPYYEGQVEIN